MAEYSVSWANLPPELLLLIAERLETDTEIRTFRSVCKQLLASTIELPRISPPLPMQLLLRFKVDRNASMRPFTLFQSTVFRLEVPGVFPKKSWLIKVSEQADGRFSLMNPFSSRPVRKFPDGLLPKEINLLIFRVSEIGTRHYLRRNKCGSQDQDSMPSHKAALPSHFESIDQRFLVIDRHARLLCPKDGTTDWKKIDRSSEYVDCVHHKDKFYALDWSGIVRVFDETTFENSLLLLVPRAYPCACGHWYLIKSRGDLYLVGKIRHRCRGQFAGHIGREIPCVEFLVFKLDDADPTVYQWKRITDLGDQIFFISRDCSYAVSFHDFYGCRSGNIIIYVDEVVNDDNADINEPIGIAETRVGFINLKLGRVLRPLALILRYYHIFWPPPNWIRSNGNDQCSTSSTT